MSLSCFPFFLNSILATVQNDDWRKKIKAISCELLAVSCELKAEAYFPLGVIRNISKGFAVVVRETLNVILNERGESIAVIRKTISVIRKMVGLDEICPQQQKKKHDLPRQRNLWKNW